MKNMELFYLLIIFKIYYNIYCLFQKKKIYIYALEVLLFFFLKKKKSIVKSIYKKKKTFLYIIKNFLIWFFIINSVTFLYNF